MIGKLGSLATMEGRCQQRPSKSLNVNGSLRSPENDSIALRSLSNFSRLFFASFRVFRGHPSPFSFPESAFRGRSGGLPFFRARRRHETDILACSKMARDDFGIRRRDHLYEF